MSGIDKSWIFEKNRFGDKYWSGATAFIENAKKYVNEDGLVKCPCIRCVNGLMQTIDVLEAHIIDRGFNPLYTKWIFHGEVEPEAQVETNNPCEDVDEMYQVLNDIVQHSEDIEGIPH